MPRRAIEHLRQERERIENEPTRPQETTVQRSIREHALLFALADSFLDKAVDGPMHLKDPKAARIVEDAILSGCCERYDLLSWCVITA